MALSCINPEINDKKKKKKKKMIVDMIILSKNISSFKLLVILF